MCILRSKVLFDSNAQSLTLCSDISVFHRVEYLLQKQSQCLRSLSAQAEMPADKPRFTDTKHTEPFCQMPGRPVLVAVKTNGPERCSGRKTWGLTEGLGKTVSLFLSVQKMQADTERGNRRAESLLGMLNNSPNQALRTAERVKMFARLSGRDVSLHPLTSKAFKALSVPQHCT